MKSARADRRRPANDSRPVLMPSEVSQRLGFFDRFAGWSSLIASRAYFFAFCVLLILVWVPSYGLIGNIDTWQLIINTATTIITFLMVALLQNSQTRSDQAIQHKLNALAHALSSVMAHLERGTDSDFSDLHSDMIELRDAVGLETHESTTHNRARAHE
jgi:low affinity Fe/Cu permease